MSFIAAKIINPIYEGVCWLGLDTCEASLYKEQTSSMGCGWCLGGKASVPSCFQFELKLRRGRARLSELLDVPGPVQIAAFGAEIIGEDLEVLVQDVEHRGLSLLLLAYQPRNQMPFSCTDCSFL